MNTPVSDRSELIFILDRSGSMYHAASDVVGGFNSTLSANKELPGECTVTTILFNHQSALLHDRLPIAAVMPMTDKDYRPGGNTALLDAIGFAMDKVSSAHQAMAAEYRPSKVQFVIMTDGLENASREYSRAMIHSRITRAREEKGWDFIFLGANIDAIATASDLGIRADRAVDAIADQGGVRAQFEAVRNASCAMRTNDVMLNQQWSAPVAADRKRRKI